MDLIQIRDYLCAVYLRALHTGLTFNTIEHEMIHALHLSHKLPVWDTIVHGLSRSAELSVKPSWLALARHRICLCFQDSGPYFAIAV